MITPHGKIYGLNRTGVRGVLKELWKAGGLPVPSSEMGLFLKMSRLLGAHWALLQPGSYR